MGTSQFALRLGWEYEHRGNMWLWCCVISGRDTILYVPNLLMPSHIMSSLSCSRSEHQILQYNIKDSSPIKRMPSKPESNSLTYSHIFTGAHCIWALYSTLCLYLQVNRHTNMITSHKLHISLPALPNSDKDAYLITASAVCAHSKKKKKTVYVYWRHTCK